MITKAQQKAVAKYVREHYDEIKIRVPQGMKDEIKERAEEFQESTNAYITRLIKEDLSRG